MGTKLLQQAIQFSKQYDSKGGYNQDEAYYLRAMMVAPIVLEYTSDSGTLLAALMHNILDRIHCSSQQIALYFNPVAQRIVDGASRAESPLAKQQKF
jgi:(p)ppGpp synthase/HD superfamily hydrolase